MELAVNGLWPTGLRHGAKDVGQTDVGRCLALFTSVGQRAFAHILHALERSRKYGPYGELFFFLLKKEPMVHCELIEFGPCISVETVKACALIGLHMTAEETALRSNSDSSPDIGEEWRYGGPKKPVCGSNGVTRLLGPLRKTQKSSRSRDCVYGVLLYLLASFRLPSLFGCDAYSVNWASGALWENCRKIKCEPFSFFSRFFLLIEGLNIDSGVMILWYLWIWG